MNILITGGTGFLGQRLARKLLERDDVKSVVVADVFSPASPDTDPRVWTVQADITRPEVIASLVTPRVDAVYHLAAVVSSAAEDDFDLGMTVNVDATRILLEAVRREAPGNLFIFTSSLAVFGGEMPATVTDQTAVNPQSSYGAQKAVGELLVNDYSRKGFVDGRVLRLPTVCVRPVKPNRAASSFVSSIIREPLQGQRAHCPVDPSTPFWLTSPSAAVENLVLALFVSAAALGTSRTVNVPGITVTVREMLAALEAVAGREAVGRVAFVEDEAVRRIVMNWPGAFDISRALRLGFSVDRDFASIIRDFMTHDLAARS